MNDNLRPLDRVLARLFPVEHERRRRGLCPTCGKAPSDFKDPLSRREYEISGMCQSCQDSVFAAETA